MIYKLNKDSRTQLVTTVSKINDDGTTVNFLMEESNTDYQAYLKWVSEGNTPEPADE
jgi:hypothetical protein